MTRIDELLRWLVSFHFLQFIGHNCCLFFLPLTMLTTTSKSDAITHCVAVIQLLVSYTASSFFCFHLFSILNKMIL